MNQMSSVGIVGLGVVGSAIRAFFPDAAVFDPAKGEIDFISLLDRSVLFLCLPTLYDSHLRTYNCSAIQETLSRLSEHAFSGLLVLKSTVTPGTTRRFATSYPSLNICHCPEFLSARTAIEDFKHQSLMIIGKSSPTTDTLPLSSLFPDIRLIVCSSDESEAAKLFCNSFYATKIQFFNELYDACLRTDMSFPVIRDIMLSLGWIHPMHTAVPGTDGKLSFGGMCFPKDISACSSYLESIGAIRGVIEAARNEQSQMRRD